MISMKKKLLGLLAVLLMLSVEANAQIGGTGVYKAHSAGVDVKVVKKPRNAPFIGFNAGIGGSFGAITSLDGTVGADFAFAPSKKFAMGFFTGYETLTKFNLGLLFVHGDYSTQGAFLWGLGLSYMARYKRTLTYADQSYERWYMNSARLLLRLGYMPKSPWYYNVTLSYTPEIGKEDLYPNGQYQWLGSKGMAGITVSVGYKLNIKSRNTN